MSSPWYERLWRAGVPINLKGRREGDSQVVFGRCWSVAGNTNRKTGPVSMTSFSVCEIPHNTGFHPLIQRQMKKVKGMERMKKKKIGI